MGMEFNGQGEAWGAASGIIWIALEGEGQEGGTWEWQGVRGLRNPTEPLARRLAPSCPQALAGATALGCRLGLGTRALQQAA
jgi:hypothetical protein